MEPVTLQADGLRLVSWEPRHLPDLQLMYDDPLVERYLVMPLPWSDYQRDRFLDLCARQWRADNPRWAVVEADGTLVASVALTHAYSREVSITYLVAPWARGKGVAQRAIRAASRFAFDNMGMHRVAWDAIVGNHASRLAAIRVGFTVEGISRNGVNQRGASRDCWVGGVVPGELRESDDPPPDYGVLKTQAAFFMGERPALESEAEGLRLRPLRGGDLDDLAAACADEETQRWTTVPRDYTREDAEKFFSLSAERWKRGTHVLYVLADSEDRFSGSVELMLEGRPPGDAEIGFHTAPWARGRGWMTAAVRCLADLGFERLALERIEWNATVGNEASRRVAEKAGFVIEGTKRRIWHGPGERVDSWTGSLLG